MGILPFNSTQVKNTSDGTLIVPFVDERLPNVVNGLVAHYPFDGRGGAVDIVSGAGTNQNVEKDVNILDCLTRSWRDPDNWTGGAIWDEGEQALRFDTVSQTALLNVFIPIITSKKYIMEATIKRGSSANGTLYAGTISYDINKSYLPGHPGSYDYFISVGSTPPTQWKTYKNDVIGGRPRTGEDSNTGNYDAWHPGTKYANIMFLPNYSGTSGPLYIKDLKFYTIDNDTSNAIITNDGIGIQEFSGANLIGSNPTAQWSPWGGWGGFTGTTINIKSDNNNNEVVLNAINGGGCQWYQISQVINITSSKIYTVSCKIKASDINKVSANFFYIREYDTNNVQIREMGVFTPSNMIGLSNGYFLTWATFTTLPTTTYCILQGYEYTGDQTISCYDFVMEEKPYPSCGYYNSANGSALSINNPVKTGEYTISFKCRIPTNLNYAIPYQTIMCMGNYYTNNSWTIMDTGGSNVSGYQTLIRKGNAGEWGWADSYMTTPSNFNKENTYTVVRNSSLYLTYLNGVYRGSIPHNSTTMQDVIWIGSRESGAHCSSSIIRDLSIYNRALTDSEVYILSNSDVSSSDTKFKTPIIYEFSKLPKNTYYFPLSIDTLDQTNTVSAYRNVNLAYEEGAVWVGTSTTNLHNESMQPFTVGSGYNKYLGFTGVDNSPRWLFVKTGSDSQYNGWESNYGVFNNLTVGQKFTISFKSAKDTIGMGWSTAFYTSDWNRTISSWTSGNFNREEYFVKSYGTVTITEAWANGAIIADGPSWGYNTSSGSIEICSLMWEMNKQFPSPYVNGTRGTSELSFNFNSSIGLNWAGNWTICYWKKAVATYDDGFENYNIESLGCNSNSVGGSYTWWGKNSGADNIHLRSVNHSISKANYFNKWHFISLVKLNGIIYFTVRGLAGTVYSGQQDFSTIASNGFVTQYGYDFKMGGWDNTNPCNSYFRDLIVCKYAMSDAQLLSIYSQFSTNSNGTFVKNIIEK